MTTEPLNIPEHTQTLYDLATAVVEHLPGFEVEFDIFDENKMSERWVVLRRKADDFKLNFGWGYTHKPKTHVYASIRVPRPKSGDYISFNELSALGARNAITKKPEVIARDIMRRIITPSAELYKLAVAGCEAADNRAAQKKELVRDFEGMGARRQTWNESSHQTTMDYGPFTFRVYNETVTIDRCWSLTGEQMAAIIELFKSKGWDKR